MVDLFVKCHLGGVHEDVEITSYMNCVLKFSFDVRETFELSGEDDP